MSRRLQPWVAHPKGTTPQAMAATLRRSAHSFETLHPVHYFLARVPRSEEHTSELQSRLHLVCRLLLEKKKKHKLRHIVLSSYIRLSTFNTSSTTYPAARS